MKKIFTVVLMLGIVCFGAGCSAKPDEYVCKAMYVPFGIDSYVMVEQEKGNVFTVFMPEEIYNLSGEKITPDYLQKGNILEITGDGLMMESYPAQYPGVTKIRVIEEGNAQDAEQYQHIIDEIYVEPDPSEPPSLQIERRTPLIASCTLATRGSYQWSWLVNENTGEMQSTIACGSPVLEWKEISRVSLDKPDRLNLLFTKEPDSVSVERWPESQKGSDSNADPETIDVQQENGTWYIDAEPGYIYAVYGKWTDGNVEYGFAAEDEKQ